jgi:hypothetical protein
MAQTLDSGLHDAELTAIHVDRHNKHARLEFSRWNGEKCTLDLHGLLAFRTEDLTLQNVVSRLLLSSASAFSHEELERWLGWATSLSDASSWLTRQRQSEWLDNLKCQLLQLVIIEPSAGAQLAAICERVEFDGLEIDTTIAPLK